MKKRNLITLAFLCVAMLAAAVMSFAVKENKADIGDEMSTNESASENSLASTSSRETVSATSTPSASEVSTGTEESSSASSVLQSSEASGEPAGEHSDMANVLFIGDSRTVGLMEYADIKNADFFCNTGMSAFNIEKTKVSVPNVGKVGIDELLSLKKYDKICIMLGINEVGYNRDTVISRYTALLEKLDTAQPDAVVFILSNLHVSQKRSSKDGTVNNAAINGINTALSRLADGKKRIYIDSNPLFDDNGGNLASDKTQDGVHLYAKYYAEWGNWICKAVSEYVKAS